jgi:HlyD family secretion protein
MWKWIIGFLAIIGAGSAIYLAKRSVTPQPVPAPIGEPVRNPYSSGIAGAGIVEPASENVVIGVSEAGLVLKVHVKEGDVVKAGAPLFETDSRLLQSQLVTAKAGVADAQASLDRVIAYRRKEEEPPLRAKLEQAKATHQEAQRSVQAAEAEVLTQQWSQKDVEARVARLEKTVRANATPEEELERVQFLVRIATAKVDSAKEAVRIAQSRVELAYAGVHQAEAELNLYLAGAWESDVKKARATLEQAKAQVQQLEMEIALFAHHLTQQCCA